MEIIDKYRALIKIPFTEQEIKTATNHSVFAILLESKSLRDRIVKKLDSIEVETKIYYEPLVKGYVNTDCIFNRILCLPVYGKMEHAVPDICRAINGEL